MKKLFIFLFVIVLISLSVVYAAAGSNFNIHISKDGKGSVTYFYDQEKGVLSIGVEETGESFNYWDIKGDYEIVNSEKDGKIFHIKPFSNLDITAVFKSALNENKEITRDSTIIQTGMGSLSFIIIVVIIALSAIILLLF